MTSTRTGAGGTSVVREQHRGRGSALLGILLHSENSLTKPKTAILALKAVKPSKAQTVSPLPPV